MAYKVLVKSLAPPKGNPAIAVKKTLQPTERDESNMEIEAGEFVVTDTMATGFPETYIAGGEPHSNGGTPVKLPENSFIFSKDKSLKLKNEEIQKSFNKKEKKTGYDFAEIAKQYDVNDWRKVLADPNSDKLHRDTAETMIKNNNEKLGKLALVQESMKGFPQGIPFISVPYLESMGIDPAQFINGGNQDEAEVPLQSEEDDSVGMAQMGGDVKKILAEKPGFKTGGGVKIKIIQEPTFQKGGPKVPLYTADALANMAKLKEMGYDITAPATAHEQKGAVDKIQKKLPTNTYGRQDWTKPELYQDFTKRAAWYLKDHPDFDPKKPKDVEAFQKAYNEKLVGMGLAPELNQDAKFGEKTYSVYNLNKNVAPIQQAAQIPVTGNAPLPALEAPTLDFQNPENNAQFWTQDMVNMAGAFGDQQRIKKYMPWQAGYSTQLPEGTYYDPTRELAAGSEQANIAAQTATTYGSPQELSGRLSAIQGQGLENAANVLGKYNTLNVNESNQLELARKNIMNADSANRANQATGLYDKTVMVNQAFDNAKAAGRQKFRQSFIDAWTNRGKTQALNSMNKKYQVDPITGFVTMLDGAAKLDPTKQSAQIEDTFNRLMENPQLKSNPEIAYKLALKTHGMAPDQDPNIPYTQYSK